MVLACAEGGLGEACEEDDWVREGAGGVEVEFEFEVDGLGGVYRAINLVKLVSGTRCERGERT